MLAMRRDYRKIDPRGWGGKTLTLEKVETENEGIKLYWGQNLRLPAQILNILPIL